MPDSTASQRALESAYAGFSHGLQDFCTGSYRRPDGAGLGSLGLSGGASCRCLDISADRRPHREEGF
jgi:hypothetical protein